MALLVNQRTAVTDVMLFPGPRMAPKEGFAATSRRVFRRRFRLPCCEPAACLCDGGLRATFQASQAATSIAFLQW